MVRFLRRFVFVYLLLSIVPFPLDLVGGLIGFQPVADLWEVVVPRVGETVFHVEMPARPNGSGDTTFNYVQVFCFFVLAVAGAAAWTVLDPLRSDDERFHRGLRLYVRLWLAVWMISYGAAKVIKSQFPDPSLDRLMQPFGDASPMGLLWAFMGASTAYNVFTGAAEMIGGLLLVSRRTTLLGALVCIGVMGHVVALNFCYDVPVKLFASHLLAVSVFLAAPDVRRLVNFFLLNRTAPPAELRPVLGRGWPHRVGLVLRTGFIVGFAAQALAGEAYVQTYYEQLRAEQPLRGIWYVEEFEEDGVVRPPLLTEDTRWRRVVIDDPWLVAIQRVDDSRERFLLEVRTDEHTLTLTGRTDPNQRSTLTYAEPEPGRLVLEGTFDGHKIRAKLRRVEEPRFRLTSRGFHWISEWPYNR
jgi:uncharacterized membrane protein YphA (DoxX/SURF4 family)